MTSAQHVKPHTLVSRLFLGPADVVGFGILVENGPDVLLGKWVELLYPDDCDVFELLLAALFQNVVVHTLPLHITKRVT